MTDVVISARIPQELMDAIEKTGKPNSVVLRQALQDYIAKYTEVYESIRYIYLKIPEGQYEIIGGNLDG